MAFNKSVTSEPSSNDLLQEKQNVATRLAQQANNAVSAVTQAMNDLESINQQIDRDIDEVDAYINNLAATREAMSQQRKHNTTIIANFAKLLDTPTEDE